MKPEQVTLIERLKGECPELYQLYEEHQEFEQRLEELNALTLLLPEEVAERKQIQKLKLLGMDKIVEILRESQAAT